MLYMKFLCLGLILNNLIIYYFNSYINIDIKCYFFLKLGVFLLLICIDIICLNCCVFVFVM